MLLRAPSILFAIIVCPDFARGFLHQKILRYCRKDVSSTKDAALPHLFANQPQEKHFSSTDTLNEMDQTVEQPKEDFPFNSAPMDEVFKELNIPEECSKQHLQIGLSNTEAQDRLKRYGTNDVPSKTRKALITLFFEQFEDRLVQILLIVAAISTISSINEVIPLTSLKDCSTIDVTQSQLMQCFVEPGVILLILIVNAAIGVWQQSSALDSMDALKNLQPQIATVLRSDDNKTAGSWLDRFDARLLVPGDIVMLKTGQVIPADIKLFHFDSSTFSVNESNLTGESVSVQKFNKLVDDFEGVHGPRVAISDQHSVVFSGTVVTKGLAQGIVVHTGTNTELGKIQRGVMTVEEMKTPLEQRLDVFADDLTRIILYLCIAIWLISIPRFNDPNFVSFNDGALYYAKDCVALGVAAIPEGLPAVITLVLSLGTKRLAERNVIVRKLPCIETLGCVTVICTDKTGTLTTNQMSVVSLMTFDKHSINDFKIVESTVSGSSFEPIGKIQDLNGSSDLDNKPADFPVYSDIISVCYGCNNSRLVSQDGTYTVIGEPTEGALLCFAEKLGTIEYNATSHHNVAANRVVWEQTSERCATLDFDHERKSMSVICKFHGPNIQRQCNEMTDPQLYRLLVKGAPNHLLERSSFIKLRDGTINKLTPELKKKIEREIAKMSRRPLRCLLLAVKDISSHHANRDETFPDLIDDPAKYSDVESDLTVIGVVGLKDPVRTNSVESIKKCTQAGVRIIVISGDARETTMAVARELNILQHREYDSGIFSGAEFFAKPVPEQVFLLSSGNLVFCRTEPVHKQLIVKRLQSIHEIVAMSGDGVNDSPALRQASIGVAMGSGSELAKEASDMILVDDSFATIVSDCHFKISS